MKFILQLLTTICLMFVVMAQAQKKRRRVPVATTVAYCSSKRGYYFCNHKDRSVDNKVTSPYKKKGFCCPYKGFRQDPRCMNDPQNGVECTQASFYPEDQGLPLYMTYWVGQTATHCNSTSHYLTAEEDLSIKIARKAVIKPRLYTIYEACYWIITVPDGQYDENASIDIWINRTNRGEFWLYEGNNRHNVTGVTPGNTSALHKSEPYRINARAGAIVVFMTEKPVLSQSPTYGGSGSFSYRVSGGRVNLLASPFTGWTEDKPLWLLLVIIIGSAAFILICIGIILCFCCGCCKK